MAEAKSKWPNTKIAKLNSKDKVLDFSDKLTEAHVDDYAMIHGCGGKGHARNSTIGVTICDFSKGRGEGKSITVSCNINPEIITMIFEVVRDRIMHPEGIQNTGSNINAAKVSEALEKTRKLYNLAKSNPSEINVNNISPIGALLGEAVKGVENKGGGTDFAYSQTKVNSYAKGDDGNAPVTNFSIMRMPYRNGEVSRYPWRITIKTGKAKPVTSAIGGVSYESKSYTKIAETSFLASDVDLYGALCRVTSYIHVWEQYYGAALLQKAEIQREEAKTDNNGGRY